MRRLTRDQDVAAPELPFLVRQLPLILTLLFIAGLHEPLTRGLAPQIEYVSALAGSEPTTYEVPASTPAGNGSLIENPARLAPQSDLISI
ncbi:hypothetical protein DYI37_19220 [Fulvimarina endophytica]|uniref:Uncharacterized protein n=1 Tax=Fulvimarina endophytica TaxID=2293836 RepID=A0A371WXY8_9HYPH|nr:hypothetical protein [Fulvimarina endophytica]RFC61819.1 hypothetical protein DYI37_19220 [Fulvimarina endophytica]